MIGNAESPSTNSSRLLLAICSQRKRFRFPNSIA